MPGPVHGIPAVIASDKPDFVDYCIGIDVEVSCAVIDEASVLGHLDVLLEVGVEVGEGEGIFPTAYDPIFFDFSKGTFEHCFVIEAVVGDDLIDGIVLDHHVIF